MYRLLAAALIVIALTCGLGRESAAQPSTYGDAMRWYEREGAKGSAKAQYFLGFCKEVASQKDLAKAFQWFAKPPRKRMPGHTKLPATVRIGHGFRSGESRSMAPVALRGRGCPKHSTIWLTCWRMLFRRSVRRMRRSAGTAKLRKGVSGRHSSRLGRFICVAWAWSAIWRRPGPGSARPSPGRLPALAKPVLLWKRK